MFSQIHHNGNRPSSFWAKFSRNSWWDMKEHESDYLSTWWDAVPPTLEELSHGEGKATAQCCTSANSQHAAWVGNNFLCGLSLRWMLTGVLGYFVAKLNPWPIANPWMTHVLDRSYASRFNLKCMSLMLRSEIQRFACGQLSGRTKRTSWCEKIVDARPKMAWKFLKS